MLADKNFQLQILPQLQKFFVPPLQSVFQNVWTVFLILICHSEVFFRSG